MTYYCEGPEYANGHCNDIGLHQCGDCKREAKVRTFLVIPDEHNGGPAFEGFVVAHSPEEACELWNAHLQGDAIAFAFDPEAKPEEAWTVREIPKANGHTGAVPWETMQCTRWRVKH